MLFKDMLHGLVVSGQDGAQAAHALAPAQVRQHPGAGDRVGPIALPLYPRSQSRVNRFRIESTPYRVGLDRQGRVSPTVP